MYEYKGKIINVVDGDTVDAIIDLGLQVSFTHRLRLLGINASETKLGPKTDDLAKQAGLAAKEYLTGRLLNQDIVVHTYKSDVYGRYLAVVYLDGMNINREMLDKGLAALFMIGSIDDIK